MDKMDKMDKEVEIRRIFSKNLRRYLSKYNISQKELGERLNVSAQAISQWVNGITLPRMGKIEMICMIFGIEKRELLEEHDPTINNSFNTMSNNTINIDETNDSNNTTHHHHYYDNDDEGCTNDIIITANTKKYFFGILDELREMDDDQLLEVLKYCEFISQKK